MHSSALIVMCLSTMSLVCNTSINYCGSKMCNPKNSHTFCMYSDGPSPDCVGYIDASLTEEEKSQVLDRLNQRRDAAAAGRLHGLTTAGDMLKLRWVEELAREAQLWADQCRPPQVPEEHDSCRDLYSVEVGQCVASVVGEAPGLRVESMVDMWYMQSILYKGNATVYIPPNLDTSFYGDFGQIIWAPSYMVGCGRSRFMSQWQGRLRSVERLVCNIAPRGPQPTRPLWTPSAPATLCPEGSDQDKTFESLCDLKKVPTDNRNVTLEEYCLLQTVLNIEQNSSLRYPRSLDELYLTKIATATTDNVLANFTKAISKPEDKVVIKVAEETTVSNAISLIQNSTTLAIVNTTVRSTKKTIDFIGRPKPYDMEELNDEDCTTENYSAPEDYTKKEKNIDAEYDFVEATEDNYTTSESSSNMDSDQLTSEEPEDISEETLINILDNARKLVRELTPRLYAANPNLFDNNPNVLNTDALTDQETIQQLQQLLEMMEREKAMGSVEVKRDSPGKARRELRASIEDSKNPSTETTPEEVSEEESSTPLSTNPMYNMVLKYLPYLKQYQADLLAKATGAASRLSPSFVLILFLFV